MIVAKEVEKKFGKINALDSISININKGSIYGLVGKNGSGKTTLLKHLAGIYIPDSGSISIDEEPVYENIAAKQCLSFIADEPFFSSSYSLDEMESLYSSLYENWDQKLFSALVDSFSLNTEARLTTLSKGNQKQAAFCLAMAASPDYLLLDEPLDGLDTFSRRQLWDTILDAVSEKDMSVLISSHNLRELEDYCDTIGIIDRGRMILEMDIDDLKSRSCKVQASYIDRPETPYTGLNVKKLDSSGNTDLLIVQNTPEEVEDCLSVYSPAILNITPLTLEEIFVFELGGNDDEYRNFF